MASIEKRKRGGKVAYRVSYRDPEGRQRSQSFTRRVDADAFRASVELDLRRGAYVNPEAGRRLFGDYAEEWRRARVHRPTTAAQVETHLRRQILPAFGARPIGSIRPTQVQAWVKGLGESLAPGTVTVVYRYLASMFRAAVADGLIVASPCRGVVLPKRERPRVAPLGTDQVHALVAATPSRYRAAVVLAAGTGLRQGEVFGLTVANVDFPRRRLEVVQQLVTVQGRAPFLGPPKTDASYRSVPLPDVVLHALVAHLADYPAGRDDLVFTNDRSEPINRTRFSDVWRRVVADAAVPAGTGFHALRHYYASLLIRHGESVKVVQSRLGHASAAETLDTYSHLWPDSEDRTRQAIDAVLGAAPPDEIPTSARHS